MRCCAVTRYYQRFNILKDKVAKHHFTDPERFTLYTADGGKCFWCGLPIYYRDVQIDHVFPEWLEESAEKWTGIQEQYALPDGFQLNSFDNWVTCHQGCNLRKLGTLLPNAPATLFVVNQLFSESAET